MRNNFTTGCCDFSYIVNGKSVVPTILYIRNIEKFNTHLLAYFFKNKIGRKKAEMNETDN